MAIYCWGSTKYGELGLGGIEDEQILTPREMQFPEASSICQIACGTSHTLFLSNQGKVYSCGNNDHGQLGHDFYRKRPRMLKFQIISSLDNYIITQLSCGASHSLAINEWGQLFGWGSNSLGQLGFNSNEIVHPLPKIVKELATKNIVQMVCGDYHCLALTNSGELYSWGANSYGQLGHGNSSECVKTPTLIRSLAGIPLAFITCGGNHSFAVSKSGAVFGWGKNVFGQLGINDDTSRYYPCQLKTLRSRGVRYISCGEDFSVFLTLGGGVFTCGSGTYGQLGHGISGNEIMPRMVMELMGSTVTQISCGRRHTLTLVPSRGRVYGFGLGGSGQLGNRGSSNSLTPQVVLGPWVSPSGTTLIDKQISSNMIINKIYSGGDHCCVSVVDLQEGIEADDSRIYGLKTQIASLSVESAKLYSEIAELESVDQDVLSSIEVIFKSQCCINSSFLLKNNDHLCCSSSHPGVDIIDAEKAFEYIRIVQNESVKRLIWECIASDLITSLVPSPADVETLRIYLILPLYHEFINVKNYKNLQSQFCEAVLRLKSIPLKVISLWWAQQSAEYFERLLEIFRSVVVYIIMLKKQNHTSNEEKPLIVYERNLVLALDLMALLYKINHFNRKLKLKYDVFHIPELLDSIDIQQDYVKWCFEKSPSSFYLCNYPFIFDAPAKTLLLQTDQGIQMHQAMQSAAAQSFMMMITGSAAAISQFVVLNVSRERIVEDTLREISQYGSSDLKKPLKIKFVDEEAEDAGGVRKEFFILLLREILDPKFGMFREYDDSGTYWFSEDSFEDENMYELIGIICGLAIYNFTIINLPFPLALYKKLLKEEPLDITDLRDLSPTIANSMQQILNYSDDDFEEVFDLTFELSREVFGEVKKFDLKPNGHTIPVTLENKKEFVDLYIGFVLNKSIDKYFKGFYKGFMKVCGGKVLELFKAYELMAVVIGNEDYDWQAFEADAEYKNGYTSGDVTIQLFWEVFHELPLLEKKKFLLFLTGSDRIPIRGMKDIKITIQPMSDDKFLPVAHTCFNLLDLPRYKTKEKLRYKLSQAIQQNQGFSLV